MPKFETEAEEAQWWYDQRHAIAEEFERQKSKLGPSHHLRKLAALQGLTVDEFQAKRRALAAESEEAPALPGSA